MKYKFIFCFILRMHNCFSEKIVRIDDHDTKNIFEFPRDILILRFGFSDLLKRYYHHCMYKIVEQVINAKLKEPIKNKHLDILSLYHTTPISIIEMVIQVKEDLEYIIKLYRLSFFEIEAKIIIRKELENINLSIKDMLWFKNLQLARTISISEEICELNNEILIKEKIDSIINVSEDNIHILVLSSRFCFQLTKLAFAKVNELKTNILDPFNIENRFENTQKQTYNYIDCILNIKFDYGLNFYIQIFKIIKDLSFHVYEAEENYVNLLNTNLSFLEDFNNKDFVSQIKFIDELDGNDKLQNEKLLYFLGNKISLLLSSFLMLNIKYLSAKDEIARLLEPIETINLKKFLTLIIDDCNFFIDMTDIYIKSSKKIEAVVNENFCNDLLSSLGVDNIICRKITINTTKFCLCCNILINKLRSFCGLWELILSEKIQNHI